jgi:nicotinamide mononucleotide transporter
MNLFSINTAFYTVLGYPMSYIEFFGTITCLASVILVARRNIWTWPVGLISVVLYMTMFYQISLYADFIEQIYYLITGFIGWWLWLRAKPEQDAPVGVQFSDGKQIALTAGFIALASVLAGWLVAHSHALLPALFPRPASYPYIDTFTTVLSFTAQWLMVRRKIESWIYWIIVDVFAVWLYYVKEVKFVSLLYVVLLLLASQGLYIWWQAQRRNTQHPATSELR